MFSQKLVAMTEASESEKTIASLTLAFSSDPVCRWIWPDPSVYIRAFPEFVRAFGGAAFGARAAYHISGHRGTALWLPPGTGPDEQAVVDLFEKSVEPSVLESILKVFDQMGAYHPHGAHWHLPLIGVEPGMQGRGCGTALLSAGLAQCDRDGLPAYLESTSPQSETLYQRMGFEPLGEITVNGSPTIVPMLRRRRISMN